MFNEKSAIVGIWVRAIKNGDGALTIENVPTFFRLRDAVKEVLASLGAEIVD